MKNISKYYIISINHPALSTQSPCEETGSMLTALWTVLAGLWSGRRCGAGEGGGMEVMAAAGDCSNSV